MVGGEHRAAYSEHNVVQRFNLATQSWSYAAPMQQPVSRPEAVVFGGEIWRIAGSQVSGGLNTVEIYNPSTNTWRFGPSCQFQHAVHGVGVLGGKVYIMDANGAGQPGHNEVYDPAVGTWSSLPGTDLISGWVQSAAFGSGILTVDSEGHSAVFDTGSNIWSAGPALPVAVGWHGADYRMVDDGRWALLLTAPFDTNPVRAFALDMAAMTDWIELENVPAVAYPHDAFTLVVESHRLHMLGRDYNVYVDPGPPDPMLAHEVAPISVPEPGTLVLLGMGAVGLVGYVWRKRRRASTLVCTLLLLLAPETAKSDVLSDFEQGHVDGWTVGPDGNLTWIATGGNPGGYLRVDDWATGGHNWIYAPGKFLGDWRHLVGERLSVDAKAVFGDPDSPSNMHVEISGPGGNAVHEMGQPMTYQWTTYVAALDPEQWDVVSGTWETILPNVSALRIEAEYHTGDDACAFDNIRLTPEPSTPVLLSMGAFGLVVYAWRRGGGRQSRPPE